MKSYRVVFSVVVCAVLGGASQAGAQESGLKVLRTTDPGTGAALTVSQSASGYTVLELAAPGLTLTKQASAGRVVTVVRVHKDELTIEASRSAKVVSTGAKRVEVTAASPQRATAALALIAGSPAAREAVKLLGKVALGEYSPLTLTLLSTRNMLLGGREAAARVAIGEELDRLVPAPRLTRVALQSSPTDCWDKYVREAVAAWQEVKDCLDSSGVIGDIGCVLLYDMRAIGAMTWWMKCVAIS